MKIVGSWGMIFLAAYLILTGLVTLVGGLGIPAVVFGILALIAGVLLLIGK